MSLANFLPNLRFIDDHSYREIFQNWSMLGNEDEEWRIWSFKLQVTYNLLEIDIFRSWSAFRNIFLSF